MKINLSYQGYKRIYCKTKHISWFTNNCTIYMNHVCKQVGSPSSPDFCYIICKRKSLSGPNPFLNFQVCPMLCMPGFKYDCICRKKSIFVYIGYLDLNKFNCRAANQPNKFGKNPTSGHFRVSCLKKLEICLKSCKNK